MDVRGDAYWKGTYLSYQGVINANIGHKIFEFIAFSDQKQLFQFVEGNMFKAFALSGFLKIKPLATIEPGESMQLTCCRVYMIFCQLLMTQPIAKIPYNFETFSQDWWGVLKETAAKLDAHIRPLLFGGCLEIVLTSKEELPLFKVVKDQLQAGDLEKMLMEGQFSLFLAAGYAKGLPSAELIVKAYRAWKQKMEQLPVLRIEERQERISETVEVRVDSDYWQVQKDLTTTREINVRYETHVIHTAGSNYVREDQYDALLARERALREYNPLKLLGQERFDDKKVVIEILQDDLKNNFQSVELVASNRLKKDRDFVLEVVSLCGNLLFQVDKAFLEDPEVVLAAICQGGVRTFEAFLESSSGIKGQFAKKVRFGYPEKEKEVCIDPSASLSLLKQTADWDKYIASELWQDNSFVERVRVQFGQDKRVVLGVVAIDGLILQKFPAFTGDIEVVERAIDQNPDAWKFAQDGLKNNPSLLAKALRRMKELNKPLYQEIWAAFWNHINLDLAIFMLGYCPTILEDESAVNLLFEKLGQDRRLIHTIVGIDGLWLQKLPPAFRGDRGIVVTAVNQNGLALQWADVKCREDASIVGIAVKQNAMAFEYAEKGKGARDEPIKIIAFKGGYPADKLRPYGKKLRELIEQQSSRK